ncbi:MAG TPA: peptide deformylase [Syntrophorhabdaceae bacterium]|nr:peptide deformylase [Syntrophorhabdaceae bacterium]
MAILQIKTIPESVLRDKAEEICDINQKIITLSKNMVETMIAAHGAGLAANQVGVPLRLFVIDASLNTIEKKPLIIMNPEIVESGEEITGEEGCLSIPGFFEFVRRAGKLRVRGIDIQGKTIDIECEGQLARAMQHEADHLNGVLFIDHLSPVKKKIFKKKYSGTER